MPPVKGLFLGSIYLWDNKHSRAFETFHNRLKSLTSPLVFQELGLDIYTLVGFVGGTTGYHISDPNVIKVSHTELAKS